MTLEYNLLRPITMALFGFSEVAHNNDPHDNGFGEGGDVIAKLWSVAQPVADKQYEEAEIQFNRAFGNNAELHNNNVGILVALSHACIHSGLGRIQQAIATLNGIQSELRTADVHLQMAVHWRAGVLFRRIGALDESMSELLRAKEIARENDWQSDEAKLLVEVAYIYIETGDPVKALASYEDAAQRAMEMGDVRATDAIMINVGTAYTRLDRHTDAEELFEQLLSRKEPPLTSWRRISVLLNLAVVKKRLEKFSEAESIYAEVLDEKNKGSMEEDSIRALFGLADLASRNGDLPRSFELLEESRQIALRMSMMHSVSEIEGMQADVLWDMGRHTDALALLNTAFNNMQQSSFTRITLGLGVMLEEKLIASGELSEAYNVLKKCNALKDSIYAKESERAVELSRMRGLMETERESLRLREEDRRKLMNDVLPAHIADRLLSGEVRIAERLDEVAVLFADIVGFTSFAANRTPDDVVVQLEQFFQAIDEIVNTHRCEKIKTIGDAYMATNSTLPAKDSDGIVRLARCALDMTDLSRQPALSHLTLRIGMHAGPAVTGVMSGMRIAYDMWGDTVNIASRMEGTSDPGKIQVTQIIADALAPYKEFTVTERTIIDVRGKGHIQTYWIERA